MTEGLTTTDNETESPTSWLTGLPEDLRKAESLSKFKDVSSLAQSYLEAEKSLNKRVAVPGHEASSDEWHKFYSRLGLPEDKRYLDQRSKEDEEYLSQYEDMFYQSGLSKKQGEQLLGLLYDYSKKLGQEQQGRLEQDRNANIDWLKSNYGDAFDSATKILIYVCSGSNAL